jgi:hypothetical protein
MWITLSVKIFSGDISELPAPAVLSSTADTLSCGAIRHFIFLIAGRPEILTYRHTKYGRPI